MIAYFVWNLNSYSGAAQQALLLAKNVNRKILIFNHNNKVYKKYRENDLIEIVDLPKSSFLQVLIIIYHTIKNKINIYHIHGPFGVDLALGVLLKKKVILKTTLLGDDDVDSLRSKKFWGIRCLLLKKISKNIVLSERLREINLKYFLESRIEKISNGVFLTENCPTLQEKENAFCFVGLVCDRKRTYESISYFIGNYAYLKDSKMYVVGPHNGVSNNPEFSDSYVAKCFELVEKHCMQERIVFTGKVSKKQTLDIFRKSKALLFFSEKEGMPNVVLEAMANNCVPIVTDMDGVMREIIEDGKQGYILESVSKCVGIDELEEIIRLQSSFDLMRLCFDINIIAEKYNKIYGNL